ncbi:MAG: hypothetical protein QOF01_3624, partial [Thermomicrobiales bacterium]|nr:hypothetical protein [Thermomicrobiales bacterium]
MQVQDHVDVAAVAVVFGEAAGVVEGNGGAPVVVGFDDEAAVAAGTGFGDEVVDEGVADALAAVGESDGNADEAAGVGRRFDEGSGAEEDVVVFGEDEAVTGAEV